MSEEEKKSIWLNDWFPVLGLVGFGVAALLLIFIVKVGTLLYALIDGVEPDAGNAVEAIRGIGWLFGAFVGGLVAVVFGTWRGLIAEKQTKVSRDQYERSLDRDYADLFTKAVEQLGTEKLVKRTLLDEDGNPVVKDGRTVVEEVTEPNIEVRLGAIYALARIARASKKDHIPIMETLCAYIRENAPAEGCEALPITDGNDDPIWNWINDFPSIRRDVQAALMMIGKRKKEHIDFEIGDDPKNPRYWLDLRDVNLRKADFREGDFRNAQFWESHLEGANMEKASLQSSSFFMAHLAGARLNGAHLEKANFAHARLIHTNFYEADLEGSRFRSSHLKMVIFSKARMEGAKFFMAQLKSMSFASVNLDLVDASNADFTHAQDLRRETLETCFGCAGTKLPDYAVEWRPQHWALERLTNSSDESAYKVWKAARAAGEKPPWVDEADWSGWDGAA